MRIESLLKRGTSHPNFCEDAMFQTSISDKWYVGAVLDGCSSAKDSYFASALFVKLIAKACKTIPYISKIQPEFTIESFTPKTLGEFILNQTFEGLKKEHNHLLLDDIELLSTLLLAVVHRTERSAWVNVSGDGFLAINNELIEIDQKNVPDYMAYHLELSFDDWFQSHTQSYEIDNFERLHITTDGILKFIDEQGSVKKSRNTAHNLLSIRTNAEQSLDHAYKSITEEQGLVPYDDIAVIRFE